MSYLEISPNELKISTNELKISAIQVIHVKTARHRFQTREIVLLTN